MYIHSGASIPTNFDVSEAKPHEPRSIIRSAVLAVTKLPSPHTGEPQTSTKQPNSPDSYLNGGIKSACLQQSVMSREVGPAVVQSLGTRVRGSLISSKQEPINTAVLSFGKVRPQSGAVHERRDHNRISDDCEIACGNIGALGHMPGESG